MDKICYNAPFMTTAKRRENIRNIAIIAHVDHGKTTLVDAMLRQTLAYKFKEGEVTVMDSNPLERERGITIFSKNASLRYKGTKINLVDTPGHADFGSEVERILGMVDGVLLLIDAFEGPMPQTKFVLRKSLELHLRPILVVNKIDRPHARPEEVVNLAFDLFCELNASDAQLDFPIVYASGREGYATLDLKKEGTDLNPLFETILKNVPPPVADPAQPFQMLVTMIDYDSYVGRIAIGRIANGRVQVGQPVALVKREGGIERGKVTKILKCDGMVRVEAESADAGDIIFIAGVENARVGDTLASHEDPKGLPVIEIDEPTLSMTFSHSTSPLAGRDGGKFLTSRHIRERLMREAMNNVGIRVEEVDRGERLKVSGRGELHLSILIETMRREGYELEVSRPHVIFKKEGKKLLEPVEELMIEVDPEFQGTVIQELGGRRSELKEIVNSAIGTVRMRFIIASRALMGFRSQFLTFTRGTGIMYHAFFEYQEFKGEIPERPAGSLIAHAAGKAVAYALWGLQERGEIFVKPGDDLYEGMIVGIHNKGADLVVNASREKKLTNMRSSGSDEAIQLIPPREITLEYALEFIEEDELVEITPKNVRLRKRYLNENERRKRDRRG